jgi:flagellar biosynthetic protein FlhB
VPRATSVITNPQHFAVALYYMPGETPTPLILARGTDAMARRIIDRARRAGVPVLPIPPLARALYFSGDIGAAIDPRLYAAVAAILAHLWRLERGIRTTLPDVDLPPELRLDAHGRRQG